MLPPQRILSFLFLPTSLCPRWLCTILLLRIVPSTLQLIAQSPAHMLRDQADHCSSLICHKVEGYSEAFLRNRHTGSHRGRTSFHSFQQWSRGPLFPHPHQHKPSVAWLTLANLTERIWSLKVVLVCIPLITKDAKHFLDICVSAFENSLLSSVPHF